MKKKVLPNRNSPIKDRYQGTKTGIEPAVWQPFRVAVNW